MTVRIRRSAALPSRRTVMLATLALPMAARGSWAQAVPTAQSGTTTVLQLGRRTIEVDGKAASVFGITRPDGMQGIVTEIGKRFRVRVENGIDAPSLIHWHGLTPPWQQDGVPGISGPPIAAGAAAEYDFPLPFGGTFWMHSHQGLQEQQLMAAPLIIRDDRAAGQQEIVLMLADFSFTPPEEIFAKLKKGGGMANMASSSGHRSAGAKSSAAKMEMPAVGGMHRMPGMARTPKNGSAARSQRRRL